MLVDRSNILHTHLFNKKEMESISTRIKTFKANYHYKFEILYLHDHEIPYKR